MSASGAIVFFKKTPAFTAMDLHTQFATLWVEEPLRKLPGGNEQTITLELETGQAVFAPRLGKPMPWEQLEELAMYLLAHGPVIKVGDTLGEDENALMRVRHAESQFGRTDKVMRVIYESPVGTSGKKWWKFW